MSKYKQLIAGIIIGVLLFNIIPVTALSGIKAIEVKYNNIKITLNGNEVKTDAEPFQYQGYTFVPLKSIVDAMGGSVAWNASKDTIAITSMQSPVTPIKKDNITYADLTNVVQNVTYQELRGNIAKFSGKIVSVLSYQNVTKYIVTLGNAKNNTANLVEIVAINDEISDKFIQGDNVYFEAEVLGYINEDVFNINFILPQLLVKKINKISGENTQANNKEITEINTTSELKEYLESKYSELETCIGKTIFTFDIDENTTTIFPWDYWIKVRYEYSFFEGAMLSNKYTKEQKNLLNQQLKEHQEKLAKDVINAMPNKKFIGGYYDSWYRYPNLRVDLQSRRYFSWTNYNEVDFLEKDKYSTTKASNFRWYDFIDDKLE